MSGWSLRQVGAGSGSPLLCSALLMLCSAYAGLRVPLWGWGVAGAGALDEMR